MQNVNIPGILHVREEWHSRSFFVLASIGATIGRSNIWRFPYLTYKHGGWLFMIAYAIALFLLGIPMIILELAMGQKM